MSIVTCTRMHIDFNAFIFFFNDTATTEIYTLSLHDALPISYSFLQDRSAAANLLFWSSLHCTSRACSQAARIFHGHSITDRKSTRLNSSHLVISYAVFCLKKKNSSFEKRERH